MKLKSLLQGVSCSYDQFDDLEINHLSFNADESNENGIFFCLRGSQVDGHKFYKKAIKNGAKVIICEKKLDTEIPQIVVTNSRKTLAKISANFFGNPANDLKIIAITGTNGKTTTSYIIKNILETAGYKVGLIGTNGIFINNIKKVQNLTTPDPIELHYYLSEMLKEHCEFVVMEASAHAIYLNKLYGIRSVVAALTNVTQDHLDYFKTFDNYAKVKENYFHPINTQNIVVNLDDKIGESIVDKKMTNTFTFSIKNKKADYLLFTREISVSGNTFWIQLPNTKKQLIKSSLSGQFNLSNIACASAVCHLLNISNKHIIEGITNIPAIPGRFNIYYNKENESYILIDFAHTPDGLKNILQTAKMINPYGKIICVFGCGGDRDKDKRHIMGEVAEALADFTILTSDNPRSEEPISIINEISKGFKHKDNYIIVVKREQAIEKAIKFAECGDLVIIAGKGAEEYQEIKGIKYQFNDKDIVESSLNNRY